MLEVAWNIIEPAQPMKLVAQDDRARLNDDHEEMLAAFIARDAVRLRAASERHAHSLNDVIAALPSDAGLLARSQ